MHQESVHYFVDQEEHIGHLICAGDLKLKRPGILLAPSWRGCSQLAKKQAQILAELGYVAMIVDLYGNGKEAENDEEAASLMLPLFIDRALLRKKMSAAYQALRQYPLVFASKIAGIGFCFGGLAIIELLRSGEDLKGVVSFHGLLGNQLGEHHAHTVPTTKIQGALLILHGHDDPLVSSEDIRSIQEEMTQHKVNWQMNIYGHTSHAFTNPEAQDVKGGMVYNSLTSERAWTAMQNFFNEIL